MIQEDFDSIWELFQSRYPLLKDWRIKIGKHKTFLGMCYYREKTIEISRYHLEGNDDLAIIDTLKHEIAHALVGPGFGHGNIWQAKCIEVGAKPERCGRIGMTVEYKWIAICPNCKHQFGKHRMRLGRITWCKKCGREKGLLAWMSNVEMKG